MDPTESAGPAGRESGSTSAVSSAEPSVQAPVAARVCEDAPKSPICESNLYIEVPLRPEEKRAVDFRDKLYLAPLTTLGNLPFRRVCRGLGADVTCGEMAMATNLLQGQASEWALLRRHPCEKLFGVQVCGGYGDCLTHCAQLLEENVGVDFVDLNLGCPIDLVVGKGAGSALLLKPKRMEDIVRGMSGVLSCPVTLKMRKGYHDGEDVVRSFLPSVAGWGASAVTIHGRSRAQRYSRLADWDYIEACAADAPQLQMIGNGDIFSYMDWERHMQGSGLATCMVGRAALIKPWLFTEIKERRHWDISATERLDMLKEFCSFGLEHWGSDTRGVETTRRFLLEWLSFLYRYVPVSLLDIVPQHVQWRVPPFVGRSDLETLLSSDNAGDWVKISSMLLGPAPEGFVFTPKHKSHAYVVDGSGELENG
ncbi:unnamed protein product [Ostreobium quekettii]|uniref:tRNA-dihydrouridine(47) synthase [NAD(P)(+)] n=1 Tax=Ostreobium quekettii TaxID=121088 RepID=A0A8S1J8C9_9CHLO|nr:unnamed protein product [Ostreobium quekettii]